MSQDGHVDLHLHTLASDGVHPPAEIVSAAHRAQLSAIAITDHDTIEGLDEARSEADAIGIRLVPGVEISTSVERASIHILGYLFDAETPGFRATLHRFRDDRHDRARRMVERLNEINVAVSFERVLEIAGDAAVGRPHVAEAILEAGHVSSFQEAFKRYIGIDGPAHVERRAPTPAEAIEFVHGAGGVTSLAHPGTLRRDDLIPAMAAAGLDAIEVWHPRHDPGTTSHYREIADRYELEVSGGSDYHGGRRGDAQVGDQPVPHVVLEALEARAG